MNAAANAPAQQEDVGDDLETDDDLDAEVDAYIQDALGSTPRPIDWRRVPPNEAAERWEELDRWVRWLVTRYALDHRDVPPCWYAHGDLVEELTALMTAHKAAFDRSASATSPAEWHQTLAATRGRLQLWTSRTGCRQREHRSPTAPAWAGPQAADYRAAFAAHVRADKDARAKAPEPR